MRQARLWTSRAFREALAVVIYAVWLALWLVSRVIAALLGVVGWVLLAFTRVRYGQAAAEEARREARASEAAGAAWRKRTAARLARRVQASRGRT